LDQNLDLEQSKATIQPIQFDSWHIMIYHDLWLYTNRSQYVYIYIYIIYNGSWYTLIHLDIMIYIYISRYITILHLPSNSPTIYNSFPPGGPGRVSDCRRSDLRLRACLKMERYWPQLWQF
jgi:hypothetical protein